MSSWEVDHIRSMAAILSTVKALPKVEPCRVPHPPVPPIATDYPREQISGAIEADEALGMLRALSADDRETWSNRHGGATR